LRNEEQWRREEGGEEENQHTIGSGNKDGGTKNKGGERREGKKKSAYHWVDHFLHLMKFHPGSRIISIRPHCNFEEIASNSIEHNEDGVFVRYDVHISDPRIDLRTNVRSEMRD
jgi:hypothetical protein